MSIRATYPNLLRRSLYAALLAWFALQSLNFAHAEDIGHSDNAQHHCIICTHGLLDDDFDTVSGPPTLITPENIAGFGLFPTSIVPVAPYTFAIAARGPPIL
jgi:hypothetical protein